MLQAAEAKKVSLADKMAAAEKEGLQRAESLALRDEVAEVRCQCKHCPVFLRSTFDLPAWNSIQPLTLQVLRAEKNISFTRVLSK